MARNVKNNEASSSAGGTRSSNIGESVVVDVGKCRSSCGYCKSGGRTSVSHGLWAHSITVDDYQDLLDRGWRRSGCFVYKPEMERTCCPSYTIRLKAGAFVPSKEQARVSRRMLRFLDGTLDVKRPELTEEKNTSKASCSLGSNEASRSMTKASSARNFKENDEEEQYMQFLSDQIDNVVRACALGGEFPSDIQLPKASVKKVTQTKKKLIEGSEDLLYTSNISFQIAATLRRSMPVEKDNELGPLRNSKDQNGCTVDLSPKTVAEKLVCSLNQLGEFCGSSIRACNGHLNFYSGTRQASFGEGSALDNAIGQSPKVGGSKRSCTEKSRECPQPRQKIEIKMKKSSFDPEEYDLYRRYQIKVHKDSPDQVTESSYRRFLVDTPLIFVPPSGDGTVPPCGFGSFHQQYVIDGRLVAVGVVDILPRCLSSKYLFWDPDLAFLSLGKYSALQEIGWVKENQVHCPSLQYYYLGYYIHSCSKMRYKAGYRPAELLCPLRYQWVPFDIASPLLDKKSYVVLSDFGTTQNHEFQHQLPENSVELHPNLDEEDRSDIGSDEDVEMAEPAFYGSENDSVPETNDLTSNDELKDAEVSNVLIGLKASRLRFKDLQRALGPAERRCLELELHRYVRLVGTSLSERMVYSLG
ncbi:arginyl-tRNA--protein transferase 2-like [Telopea speciosissima]|uniref:arginyl-tRNA--protein transferase 2-like n=1 Tax=Telopea speciosissima TaxID=54955 RepID=UPI001CC57656|nr:arginyl-tRNA--protein transferase 2-like [Telopea speciosissima]